MNDNDKLAKNVIEDFVRENKGAQEIHLYILFYLFFVYMSIYADEKKESRKECEDLVDAIIEKSLRFHELGLQARKSYNSWSTPKTLNEITDFHVPKIVYASRILKATLEREDIPAQNIINILCVQIATFVSVSPNSKKEIKKILEWFKTETLACYDLGQEITQEESS